MNCPNCGKEVPDDSRFCEFCGAKVRCSFNKKSFWLMTGILVVVFIIFGVVELIVTSDKMLGDTSIAGEETVGSEMALGENNIETYFFSVSPKVRVQFSPGNLQYNAVLGDHQCADGTTKPGTWRFAEHQWDFVGNDVYGNVYYKGEKCNNAKLSKDYDGWMDLFAWGTSGYRKKYPYMTKTNSSRYGDGVRNIAGTNYDWGLYNQIGYDSIGTWRTLTNGEWDYLFHGRENAENLFGMGNVNGVNGVVILPDNWECPPNILFTPSVKKGLVWGRNFYKYECESNDYYYNSEFNNYSHNTYTAEQWAVMECGGAVFLPTTGYRYYYNHVEIENLNSGNYYASTQDCRNYTDSLVYLLSFSRTDLIPQHQNWSRANGYSVRLVRNIQF